MAMNRVQFQQGMSLHEFMQDFGTEAQCALALEKARWPTGFHCPACGWTGHYRVRHGSRTLLQCGDCRHQTSLTAGTVLEGTKLPLRTWFLAMYLISQAKTGLSALALKRHLGVSYRTAWLVQHKLMDTMSRADAQLPLQGQVLLDDAYLGGEHPGPGGRGSPNKVPIVAAVSINEQGHPMQARISALSGFTRQAIAQWAGLNLRPGTDVLSDGLNCFAGVIDAGCAHSFIVVGQRKPREMEILKWVNTVLGNLKTAISGAHKAFRFAKYASHYLGAFNYRFNHRFDLHGLLRDVLGHVAHARPLTERNIRQQAETRD